MKEVIFFECCVPLHLKRCAIYIAELQEPTFRKYCRELAIRHEKVNPGKKSYVTKEIYHIQNVNAFHERFKGFLAHCRGVASKCLNHYLAWHRILDQTQTQQELAKVKNIFLQALAKPMKTTGKRLSAYCAEQLKKLGG